MSGVTLKLDPAPTFWAKVGIPVPGGEPAPIECEFAHMTRDGYAAFIAVARERSDVETTLLLLRGWRGPDLEFSPEAVAKLLQNYHGAAYAIAEAFSLELGKARSGN